MKSRAITLFLSVNQLLFYQNVGDLSCHVTFDQHCSKQISSFSCKKLVSKDCLEDVCKYINIF